MENRFNFGQNQPLMIHGIEYRVVGGIEFYNTSDGSLWQEYCLKSVQGRETKWLSVDHVYREYAIYTECGYQDEAQIIRNGYHEVDRGMAEVKNCFGSVDVFKGDRVSYVEYEDRTEEYIVGIERWEDEVEYSTGVYLDWGEILVRNPNSPNEQTGMGAYSTPVHKAGKGGAAKLIGIMVMAFGVIFAIVAYQSSVSNNRIRKYLEKSTSYTYETSITSDLNSKQKADVYFTSLTVEAAAKDIIDGIDGKTEDVQESDEGDGSVAILTSGEYCLVYTTTDNITAVQISSRKFTYQSTNEPYRSHHNTGSYYRRYYYSRGYSSDSSKYSGEADGYESFSSDWVSADANDIYNSYSQSVRQSSISSRSSSGGGISSGK